MADRSPTDHPLATLLDDLVFPECPRWREGKLWFGDRHDHRILRVTEDGRSELVGTVEGQPGGLGWLPDGRLLVVSMTDRRLLRLDPGGFEEVADLSGLVPADCNDLVVDPRGHAYVGNMGSDLPAGAEPAPTVLVCVDTDGEAWVVADQLLFPNGMVITEDRTLVVAETFGQRLSAFDIQTDGSLANPRVWCDLRPNVPDGICLDAQGAIWVADPVHDGVMRVLEGQGALEWIPTPGRHAFACALGGSDGRILFVCTAPSSDPAKAVAVRGGRIETTRVTIPAAGHPDPT